MRFFAAVVFSLFSFFSQAQHPIVFKMVLFGDSVGLSTVTHDRDASGTDIYTLDSRIKAKILWIVRENHTHYESKYKDGKLLSAVYYEMNNGKKDKWSNISYDGQKYQVDSYRGHKVFTETPTHSIGTMYCDRYDMSRKRFFYEPEANFNELTFAGSEKIEFKSSDGNRNMYFFKNGQIDGAEFHTALATLYLKRIK